MEFLQYLLIRIWSWIATHGLSIASLLVLIVLIPRIRRFVLAIATSNMEADQEENKGRRALIGAVVYTVEIIAYFIIILAILGQVGISLTAAAIPATVISAAIGFGAQGLIGDFLGGIFIIAEKQYGIGDWVEFHSPSGTVQGDVVNMTLRATTIRTMKGEEVIIPNSDARMCVNYSSRWSRAVVEVPVPMTAGGSIKDLEERTLTSAEEAISVPSIKKHVLSEIKLQSSTEINPPTAMGLPWTVTMRLVVDCEPGDQWLIERAVRAAVIDTWWDDYGQRAEGNPLSPAESITGHYRDTSMLEKLRVGSVAETESANQDAARDALAAHAKTEVMPGYASPVVKPDDWNTEEQNTAVLNVDSDGARPDIPSAGARLDQEYHAAKHAKSKKSDSQRDESKGSGGTGDANLANDTDNGSTIKEDPVDARKSWGELTRRQKIRRVLSAGGRARPSTVVLLISLFILGLLNLATVETEDGPNGWLAPSRFSVGEEETPTDATEPTSKPDDAEKKTPEKPTTAVEQPEDNTGNEGTAGDTNNPDSGGTNETNQRFGTGGSAGSDGTAGGTGSTSGGDAGATNDAPDAPQFDAPTTTDGGATDQGAVDNNGQAAPDSTSP
ncbi:mechanosensitive ion channel family protein [Corynebacterium sp. H113]|uniref:mechanosensitive ion channel family protein n=1 Tax=Corynebacterium sp. H113 TaxID=3133419 RepID=UPI0030B06FF6